ncbi:MAG: hypothetical protein V7607_4494 [Solirubrobacteraceae bacterium]
MRRYAAVITAATAAAVIGGGVAFGSAQNDPAPTPSPVPASSIPDSLQTKCEQSADEVRRQYPDAYIADCNYGETTVTSP